MSRIHFPKGKHALETTIVGHSTNSGLKKKQTLVKRRGQYVIGLALTHVQYVLLYVCILNTQKGEGVP